MSISWGTTQRPRRKKACSTRITLPVCCPIGIPRTLAITPRKNYRLLKINYRVVKKVRCKHWHCRLVSSRAVVEVIDSSFLNVRIKTMPWVRSWAERRTFRTRLKRSPTGTKRHSHNRRLSYTFWSQSLSRKSQRTIPFSFRETNSVLSVQKLYPRRPYTNGFTWAVPCGYQGRV